MKRVIGCALLVLSTLACTNASRPRAQEPESTSAGPTDERSRPPELASLIAALDDLAATAGDPTHGRLVAALSALADVLRPDSPEAAAEIDRLATQLVRSPPFERTHAELAANALTIALDALAEQLPPDAPPALRAAYVSARRARSTLEPAQPLRPQRLEVIAILRAMTNTVALLRDFPAVYPDAEETNALGRDLAELARRTREASALVSELARAQHWKPAGEIAARALHALAGVVEVAPLTLERDEWKLVAAAVRYEAFELEREGALSLQRSDRIKAGLLACTDALEHVDGAGAPAFEVLARTAREAARTIDTQSPSVFARGALQEAFRSTVDAYLVLALTARAAPGIADAAPEVRRSP